MNLFNLINLILNRLAVFAEKAAEFSAGTASHGGMYEPRMPEGLKQHLKMDFSLFE